MMENQKEICEGLLEVCNLLAEQTKGSKYEKEFKKKADVFKNISTLS